jgi:hypothetical protein
LSDRSLGRIEPRRGLPHPFAPEPRRVGDIAETDAGIDQRQTVIGLDEEAVTHHPRPLEHAAGAVHEAAADRAHGAGVDVVDAHRKLLEPFPFRLNRNGALSFVLTRFLHANRYPLRLKTLWAEILRLLAISRIIGKILISDNIDRYGLWISGSFGISRRCSTSAI